jgi:hypothetical protein
MLGLFSTAGLVPSLVKMDKTASGNCWRTALMAGVVSNTSPKACVLMNKMFFG